jgi:DNA-binding response OmpR family regulator
MRVLVVEDESVLAGAIADGLRREGWAVDVSTDGADALFKAGSTAYDVVVLDRDLQLVHGDDVCRTIVAAGGLTRVLMLTASGGLAERVSGLELGADDYLPKPFAFAELVARVRAVGRRASAARPPQLRWDDVTLDSSTHHVTRDGAGISLSPKEFAVLTILLEAQGAVVSTEQLLERAWDEFADPFTNAPRMVMVGLRRRLGDPPVIETVPRAGYRLVTR